MAEAEFSMTHIPIRCMLVGQFSQRDTSLRRDSRAHMIPGATACSNHPVIP